MSDGVIIHGQQFDPNGDQIPLAFYEQMMDLSGPDTNRRTGNEGDAYTDLRPVDRAAAKRIVWDTAAIQATLDTVFYFSHGNDTIELPDVLTGIDVVFSKIKGDGATSFPVSGAGGPQQNFLIDQAGGGGLSPRAEAQASVNIVGTVTPKFKAIEQRRVPVIYALLYVAENLTRANFITRVNAVLTTPLGAAILDWPNFKQKEIYITVVGQQISLRQSAESQANLSFTQGSPPASKAESFLWGNGYSKEVGQNVQKITVPKSLHETITLSSTSDTETATTTVKANTVELQINGVGEVGAITNEPTPITVTATATVTASDLSATSPTNIPVTGLYLYDIRAQPSKWGRIAVLLEIVNMAHFA